LPQNLLLDKMQTFNVTNAPQSVNGERPWESIKAALALHFAWYNFCRVHLTVRVTRAMEAGLADHIWSPGESLNEVSSQ